MPISGWQGGPKNPPEPPDDNEDDGDEVVDWRLRVYLELGVPREDAEHLSRRADVDWHVLKRLLERGCDIDTALRIVA